MVGLVVATHGQLAEELLRTAAGIVGPLERCEALSIAAGSSMEGARSRLGQAIDRVDDGQGVLILTDMFGGTPANLALTFLEDRIEVVTGRQPPHDPEAGHRPRPTTSPCGPWPSWSPDTARRTSPSPPSSCARARGAAGADRPMNPAACRSVPLP